MVQAKKKPPAKKPAPGAPSLGKPARWPPTEPVSIEAIYALLDVPSPSVSPFRASLWGPRLAELHMEAGRHERAHACLACMSNSYEAPCEQVATSALLAMRAARRGLTDAAERYLSPALAQLDAARARHPARAAMLLAPVGAAQVLLGRRAEGMARLDAARAAIDPGFARTRVAVARAYVAAGEIDRAIEVVTETPDTPDRVRDEIGTLLHEAGLSAAPAVLSRVIEASASPHRMMFSELDSIGESFLRMGAHHAGLESLSYFKSLATTPWRDRIVWDWLHHDRDAALTETARLHGLATHPLVRISLARITSQADPTRALRWVEADAEAAATFVLSLGRPADPLAELASACALVGRFDLVESYASRVSDVTARAYALCAALAPTLPTEHTYLAHFKVPSEPYARLSARAVDAAARDRSAARHASLAAAAFLQGDEALRVSQLTLARAALGAYDHANALLPVARANDLAGVHHLFLSKPVAQRKKLYRYVLPALVAHGERAALYDLLSQLEAPLTHDGTGCRGQELLAVAGALEHGSSCRHPIWTW